MSYCIVWTNQRIEGNGTSVKPIYTAFRACTAAKAPWPHQRREDQQTSTDGARTVPLCSKIPLRYLDYCCAWLGMHRISRRVASCWSSTSILSPSHLTRAGSSVSAAPKNRTYTKSMVREREREKGKEREKHKALCCGGCHSHGNVGWFPSYCGAYMCVRLSVSPTADSSVSEQTGSESQRICYS